jgi:hypothetical protein
MWPASSKSSRSSTINLSASRAMVPGRSSCQEPEEHPAETGFFGGFLSLEKAHLYQVLGARLRPGRNPGSSPVDPRN